MFPSTAADRTGSREPVYKPDRLNVAGADRRRRITIIIFKRPAESRPARTGSLDSGQYRFSRRSAILTIVSVVDDCRSIRISGSSPVCRCRSVRCAAERYVKYLWRIIVVIIINLSRR